MTETISFPLGGGLDLITPAVAMPPGRVIAALNYVPMANGYQRIRGYERYNGEPAPSDAVALRINYDDNGLGGNVLQILTGELVRKTTGSLAIGFALSDATLLSGTWGTSTAVGQVVISPISTVTQALLVDNVQIRVSPNNVGYQAGAYTVLTDIPTVLLAQAQARSTIDAVPGEGPVRGVWFYGGQVIAVRDNVGATAGVMHRDGAAGWQTVAISRRLNFTSGGTTELEVGNGIVGATSAATADVTGVVLTSGAWAAGTAAGYLLISAQAGTFVAENIDRSAGPANVATIAGDSTVVTLPPGGRYKFVNHNFYGLADREAMYAVNGVGNAFEYDGTTINVAIVTGTATDTPHSIAAHHNALFLAYDGGSVQFSVVGSPLVYDALLGAGEIAIGDEVVDFIPANAGTLAILGATSISVLYGFDATDYQLETINAEAGALEHTAQKIGQVLYMDNRGLRGITASADYGNFSFGTISRMIQPLLEDFRHDNVNPVASIVSRHNDQYWVFFDNDTALVCCFSKKNPEFLPVELGFTVTCSCSVEVDGDERIFLGGDDGFVYELDKGTTFDGAVIEHYVRLPFNHFGAPRVSKRLNKVFVDLEATGQTTVDLSFDLDYGSVTGIPGETIVTTTGGGAIDDLGSNEQYYASQIETVIETDVDAVCQNVSMKVSGSTAGEEPHTLTGVTYHLTPLEMAP